MVCVGGGGFLYVCVLGFVVRVMGGGILCGSGWYFICFGFESWVLRFVLLNFLDGVSGVCVVFFWGVLVLCGVCGVLLLG